MYKIVVFYVVYFFMREMELDIQMSCARRSLTTAELQEFQNGAPAPFRIEDLDKKTLTLMDRIHFERYKKEDFEIATGDLTLG